MSDLARFTLFHALPTELRINIWEHVPQPQRIVTLVSCNTCSRNQRSLRTTCEDIQHQLYRARWVINSSKEAVFPPLHACREARDVWLRYYVSLPRYLELSNIATERQSTREASRLRFDVPFVDYEKDIFTIDEPGRSPLGEALDPFLGFSRSLVRHIAIVENAWNLEKVFAWVQPQYLPRLQNVTVLTLGPEQQPHQSPEVPVDRPSIIWREMDMMDIQLADFDLVDLYDQLISEHPFFGSLRLQAPAFTPEPNLRRLKNYMVFFKFWLWHARHWDSMRTRPEEQYSWWDIHSHVFHEPMENVCPLRNLPQWCPGDHSKEQILNGVDGLVVDARLLIAKDCLRQMSKAGALELDPVQKYDKFVLLRKAVIKGDEQKSVSGPTSDRNSL